MGVVCILESLRLFLSSKLGVVGIAGVVGIVGIENSSV